MSLTEVLVALAILVGLVGVLVPILPGLVLVLVAILVWAIDVGIGHRLGGVRGRGSAARGRHASSSTPSRGAG